MRFMMHTALCHTAMGIERNAERITIGEKNAGERFYITKMDSQYRR